MSLLQFQIPNSLFGIAVKDLSSLRVNQLNQDGVDICIAAFQKKQEFGGGLALVSNIECKGEIKSDAQSLVKIRK